MPLLMLGAIYVAFAMVWSLWLGGNLAANQSGDVQVPSKGIGLEFLFELVEAGGPEKVWTATPPMLIYGAASASLFVLVGLPFLSIYVGARRANRSTKFSNIAEFSSFTRSGRSKEAARLQPNPTPFKKSAVTTFGVPLGKLDGEELFAGLEDVMLTIAGPLSLIHISEPTRPY